jgi:membrane protease YdiL (CAAX protease family)
MWRARLGWIAFLLLGIPAIYAAGALLGGKPAGLTTPLPALSAIAFMLVLGPVEELGWRGVALPLLQRRMAPVWAGLVLGVIWGLWHLPAFFVGGTPQSGWGFGAFFAGAVAVSVILTAFFNRSGGSLLWAALFHFQLNNPLWPDAQPHDTILFVVAAFVVIWVQRGAMFDRRVAVTRVLAPAR